MFNNYNTFTIGNLFDKQLKRFPNKEVQIFEDGTRQTYAQLNDRANKLANGLLGLGLKKGDFVAIYAMNCLEYMEIELANARVGIVSVLLNCFMPKERIAYMLNLSGAKAVIFEDQYKDVVKYCENEARDLEHLIMINRDKVEPGERVLVYNDLITKSENSRPAIPVSPMDPNTLVFNTGTTGEPKAVLKSMAASLFHAMANNFYETYYDIAHKLGTAPYCNFKSIVVPPLFHIGGQSYLMNCFLMQRSIVIMRKYEPEKFLYLIDRERINCAWLQPAMLFRLKQLPDKTLAKYDRGSIMAIICGGSSIKREEADSMVDFFPNANLSSNYGSTETGTMALVTREEIQRMGGNNLGIPVLGADFKILDEAANEVPIGEVGRIWITSLGLPINCEYYKDPVRSEECFRDGWAFVGDLGYQGEEGYTYYFGRSDDIIQSAGEKITPLTVQSVLLAIEGIEAAEVIGVPDTKWGEAVKAFVIRDKGSKLSEDEIIRCVSKQDEGTRNDS